VNQPAPMYLAHCDGEFDRQSQKAAQIHWRAEKPVEWLAAWIPEHQLGPTPIPYTGDRLSSPVRVQFAAEIKFVLKTLKGSCARVLGGRGNDQDRGERTVSMASIKNELFARPQLIQVILGKIKYHTSVCQPATSRRVYWCYSVSPKFSAIWTSSTNDFARIFCMTLPRCIFTVISLVPSSPATCLFNRPRMTRLITSRSRGVRVP